MKKKNYITPIAEIYDLGPEFLTSMAGASGVGGYTPENDPLIDINGETTDEENEFGGD